MPPYDYFDPSQLGPGAISRWLTVAFELEVYRSLPVMAIKLMNKGGEESTRAWGHSALANPQFWLDAQTNQPLHNNYTIIVYGINYNAKGGARNDLHMLIWCTSNKLKWQCSRRVDLLTLSEYHINKNWPRSKHKWLKLPLVWKYKCSMRFSGNTL